MRRESAFFLKSSSLSLLLLLLRLSIFSFVARHLFLDAIFSNFVHNIIIVSLRVVDQRDDETNKDDGDDDDDAFKPAFADDDDFDENDDFDDDSSRETDDTREDTKTFEETSSSVRRRSICQKRREGKKTAQRGADEKTVRRVSRCGESAVLQLHDETHRVGRRTGRISRG